jgi:chromosome segregation protein
LRSWNKVISNLRNLENEKKLTIQRQQFISENEKKLDSEISRAEDFLSSLKEEIVEVNIELNLEKRVSFRLEQELDAAQKELDEIKNNHSDAKSLMDNILLEQNKYEKSVVDLEKLKAVNQSQIDNLSKANETNQIELNQILTSMDSLSSEVDKLVADELNQQAFINGLDHKEQIRLEKLAQLEIQKDSHNQDLIKIRRELDASKNELKLTKSMVDNLEGFPESIHFLTKQKEWSCIY